MKTAATQFQQAVTSESVDVIAGELAGIVKPAGVHAFVPLKSWPAVRHGRQAQMDEYRTLPSKAAKS